MLACTSDSVVGMSGRRSLLDFAELVVAFGQVHINALLFRGALEQLREDPGSDRIEIIVNMLLDTGSVDESLVV